MRKMKEIKEARGRERVKGGWGGGGDCAIRLQRSRLAALALAH